MTYEQAMQFWFGRINYEVKSPRPSDLSLDRMRLLLELLGNPHERFRIVHVAGSKGKGSTSAMLASILNQAGYRTGLFTSPHLVAVEERIEVDRVPVSPHELTRLMDDIQEASRSQPGLERALTFFEIATALGFLHFARRRVDVAVVEVGLGGRFDSTNVCRPLLAIITSISLDHTQYLGDTLEQIAMEKAGIVKPGRPTLSGVRAPEARAMIESVCRSRGSPLCQVDVDYRFHHEPAVIGEPADRPARVQVTTRRQSWPLTEVGLMGAHQAANAALVVAAVEELRCQGLAVGDQAVAAGLARVRWPARLEITCRRPLVVLDCAHNVASAEALMQSLQTSFPSSESGRRKFLLFAGSRDKDLVGMLRILVPEFDYVALTRFAPSPRSVPPEVLAQMLPPGTRAELFPTAAAAWKKMLSLAAEIDLICVTGSVFLAGELRPLMTEKQAGAAPTFQPDGNGVGIPKMPARS
jgi:dihydrofolate synthase/folylpolyglutamate synthase